MFHSKSDSRWPKNWKDVEHIYPSKNVRIAKLSMTRAHRDVKDTDRDETHSDFSRIATGRWQDDVRYFNSHLCVQTDGRGKSEGGERFCGCGRPKIGISRSARRATKPLKTS